MKLTPQQIQLITEWLNNQKINYTDIWGRSNKKKLYFDIQCEMIDHIASDIENHTEKKAETFNEAFDEAKQKWSSKELKKLEIEKNKTLRKKYFKLYFTSLKQLLLSPYILLVFLVGFILFKLLMVDAYWFSQVKLIVAISCLSFGLLLILINMYQTEKINGKEHPFMLNALSYRIIASLTGINAVIANVTMNLFVEPMNFFNSQNYDFYNNSLILSFLLTLMLCNISVVYFVVHKNLKRDLKTYIKSYSN